MQLNRYIAINSDTIRFVFSIQNNNKYEDIKIRHKVYMTKKNVFVPGGHGFLGQHVVRILRERGFDCFPASQSDGYDFRNYHQTKQLFTDQQFDAVINCASYVGGIQFGYEHPGELFFNNILMSTYLMEAARLSGVERYVNPISNCAYPAALSLFHENEFWDGELHESVMVYGFVRKASWVQSWAYHKQYGFDSVNLILPNMYGPGDHFDETRSHALGALVMKMVEAKRKKLPGISVWGSGSPVREWLYVEDGADALVTALSIPPRTDPVNIGVGKGISIADLAFMIKEVVDYEGELKFDTSKPDGAPCKIMDIEKMKEMWDWLPRTPLREGIEKTVSWYLENR